MKTAEVVIMETFPEREVLKNFRTKGLIGYTRKEVPCLNLLPHNVRVLMTKRKIYKE